MQTSPNKNFSDNVSLIFELILQIDQSNLYFAFPISQERLQKCFERARENYSDYRQNLPKPISKYSIYLGYKLCIFCSNVIGLTIMYYN